MIVFGWNTSADVTFPHFQRRKFDTGRPQNATLGLNSYLFSREREGPIHRADPFVKNNTTKYSLSNSSVTLIGFILMGCMPPHSQKQPQLDPHSQHKSKSLKNLLSTRQAQPVAVYSPKLDFPPPPQGLSYSFCS